MSALGACKRHGLLVLAPVDESIMADAVVVCHSLTSPRLRALRAEWALIPSGPQHTIVAPRKGCARWTR